MNIYMGRISEVNWLNEQQDYQATDFNRWMTSTICMHRMWKIDTSHYPV